MTTTYRVDGMTCGGCVATLTKALERALPDVTVEVVLDGGRVRVDGDHEEAAVEGAVEDAGFDFVGRG